VRVDGKYETRTFECSEDVWDVIDLIIEETREFNEEKGKEFDIAKSVNAQLPFFACRSLFLNREDQKDIERYIYCKEFGIQPFEGSYGQQPAIWVDKAFIIKGALAKKEKDLINESRNNNNKV